MLCTVNEKKLCSATQVVLVCKFEQTRLSVYFSSSIASDKCSIKAWPSCFLFFLGEDSREVNPAARVAF